MSSYISPHKVGQWQSSDMAAAGAEGGANGGSEGTGVGGPLKDTVAFRVQESSGLL